MAPAPRKEWKTQDRTSRIMTRDRVPRSHASEPDNQPAHGEQDASIVHSSTTEVLPSPPQIAEALRHILESEYFRASARGKQFLRYVVQYRLENHPEPLKERMIGAALFNRPLDYATGDDSVVRAQAREVRHRLEKYYMAHAHENLVRIDLPVGTYTPAFKVDVDSGGKAEESRDSSRLAIRTSAYPAPETETDGALIPRPKIYRMVYLSLLALVACLSVLSIFFYRNSARISKSTVAQFWSPALASSKPLLICLPKPILYRPTAELYKRSAQVPGEFDREVYRMNHRPHLQPEDKLTWSEMFEFYDYGVGQGDVQAAVRLSNFMGHQGKDSEVRIGNGYSYEDLRNSPAVVIGAFSNPWTIEMTSELHFSFVDDAKGLRIQEQCATGRAWYTVHGSMGKDYGLVTRLVDSNTGQFVVLVAGIEASGSDAAADLVVNQKSLERVMQDAPKDWPQKNVQIVVSTEVKDTAAGPPKVVAIFVW